MRISLLPLIAIAACTGADAAGPVTPSDREPAAAPGLPVVPVRTGDVHDFDFLNGAWSVHNRTVKPNEDKTETVAEFQSTSCNRSLLGGVVNIEETEFPSKGYSAMALRTYDIKKRQWAIYWIESRVGIVLPPVYGGFEGDRGEFYGADDVNGKPALFRFLWNRLGPDRARWEQSYTLDGVEWKSSWVMEWTRTGATCPG